MHFLLSDAEKKSALQGCGARAWPRERKNGDIGTSDIRTSGGKSRADIGGHRTLRAELVRMEVGVEVEVEVEVSDTVLPCNLGEGESPVNPEILGAMSLSFFFVMPPFPSFSLCVCPENTLLRPFLRAEIRTSDRKGRACLALFQDVPRTSKSRVQVLTECFLLLKRF